VVVDGSGGPSRPRIDSYATSHEHKPSGVGSAQTRSLPGPLTFRPDSRPTFMDTAGAVSIHWLRETSALRVWPRSSATPIPM